MAKLGKIKQKQQQALLPPSSPLQARRYYHWSENLTSEGIYPIEGRIDNWEENERLLWKSINMEKPEIKFVKIYAVKNKKVEFIGHHCTQCKKIFRDLKVVENHKNVCRVISKSTDRELAEEQIKSIISYRKDDDGYDGDTNKKKTG